MVWIGPRDKKLIGRQKARKSEDRTLGRALCRPAGGIAARQRARLDCRPTVAVGRGSPYYPVGNRVVAVRSTSVIPSPFCSVFTGNCLSWSGTRLRPGLRSLRNCGARAPCHCVWTMLLTELRSSCSLRNCGVHAPCGHVQVMLLAERLAFAFMGTLVMHLVEDDGDGAPSVVQINV
ncbi:hypothetical protein Tco_0301121 [Tanacetum coccineum]